jgi:hypothetical protein
MKMNDDDMDERRAESGGGNENNNNNNGGATSSQTKQSEDAANILELCRDVCLKCTPHESLHAFNTLFAALNTIETTTASASPLSLDPALFGSQYVRFSLLSSSMVV